MADIAITPANVSATSNTAIDTGTAGATIAAGKAVYRDPITKKIGLADSNGSAEAKNVIGIALNSASLNQPVSFAKGGSVNIGGTLAAGSAYWLSDTPGGIAPFADVGTGETAILLGIATSTTTLRIAIINSGATL